MNQRKEWNDVHTQFLASRPNIGEEGPLFSAPWQARVFALIVALVEKDRLPWKVFQANLVRSIMNQKTNVSHQTSEEINDQYFSCWLEAAENTCQQEGFVEPCDVARRIEQIRVMITKMHNSQLSHPH